MALMTKLMLFFTIFPAIGVCDVLTSDSEPNEALKLYGELCASDPTLAQQPLLQVLWNFEQATYAAGRCNGDYDCSWPTTRCLRNRCVKPSGEGGQCRGDFDCRWPTNHCRNGNCETASGSGGECRGDFDCRWPYGRCKSGYCERP